MKAAPTRVKPNSEDRQPQAAERVGQLPDVRGDERERPCGQGRRKHVGELGDDAPGAVLAHHAGEHEHGAAHGGGEQQHRIILGTIPTQALDELEYGVAHTLAPADGSDRRHRQQRGHDLVESVERDLRQALQPATGRRNHCVTGATPARTTRLVSRPF
jgi:hypothetical protein